MTSDFLSELASVRTLGERICKCREAIGLSQEELGASVYVTQQQVSRWENGDRVPDNETRVKLARVLHVPVFVLFDEVFCDIIDESDVFDEGRTWNVLYSEEYYRKQDAALVERYGLDDSIASMIHDAYLAGHRTPTLIMNSAELTCFWLLRSMFPDYEVDEFSSLIFGLRHRSVHSNMEKLRDCCSDVFANNEISSGDLEHVDDLTRSVCFNHALDGMFVDIYLNNVEAFKRDSRHFSVRPDGLYDFSGRRRFIFLSETKYEESLDELHECVSLYRVSDDFYRFLISLSSWDSLADGVLQRGMLASMKDC